MDMLIWVKWFCYAQEQVSADLDFAHVDRPTYQAVRGSLSVDGFVSECNSKELISANNRGVKIGCPRSD